jgi:hypothetical protein
VLKGIFIILGIVMEVIGIAEIGIFPGKNIGRMNGRNRQPCLLGPGKCQHLLFIVL